MSLFRSAKADGPDVTRLRPSNWNQLVDSLQGRALNVQDYGAIGNGVADDTAAIQVLLNGGGTIVIPKGTFIVSSPLTYVTTTSGPLRLIGAGPGSILKFTGTSGTLLRVTGSDAATHDFVYVENLRLEAASATAAALLHLNGVAAYGLRSLNLDGKNKSSVGLLMTGTQQGEIADCSFFQCAKGVRFEQTAGGHSSNAADIHGCTFAGNTTLDLEFDGIDDSTVTANHFVASGASKGISYTALSGTGWHVLAFNHIEGHAVGVEIKGQKVHVLHNQLYQTPITVTGGSYHNIVGNILTGAGANVNLSASDHIVFANNITTGVVTNTTTFLTAYGNRSVGGTPLSLDLFQRALNVVGDASSSPGPLLTLTAPAVAGHWGMKVVGAGGSPNLVYYQFASGAVLQADGGSPDHVEFRDGVGGALWGRADNTGLRAVGALQCSDGMAAPGTTVGVAKIYVDSADGDLKVVFGDGVVKTIVLDT